MTDRELFKKEEGLLDSVTKFTLKIWYSIVRKYGLQTEAKILRWITHDKRFSPGISDWGFERWTHRGITAICTLVERGEMQSFQDLRDKFNLEANKLFRYFQVRDYYLKEIKLEEPKEQNGIIQIMINAYERRNCKVISTLYQALGTSGDNSTVYIKVKWEKELGIAITEEDWYNICTVQHSTTCSRAWRQFGWKIFYNTKD